MKSNNAKRTSVAVELNIDAGELVIRMPLQLPPAPSASGKTLVIASTRGNLASTATYDGQPIIVGVNAYVRKT